MNIKNITKLHDDKAKQKHRHLITLLQSFKGASKLEEPPSHSCHSCHVPMAFACGLPWRSMRASRFQVVFPKLSTHRVRLFFFLIPWAWACCQDSTTLGILNQGVQALCPITLFLLVFGYFGTNCTTGGATTQPWFDRPKRHRRNSTSIGFNKALCSVLCSVCFFKDVYCGFKLPTATSSSLL